MTYSASAILIDNVGQLEASETVRFGVDGRVYEIDLPARRASELRSMVGRYISVARKNAELIPLWVGKYDPAFIARLADVSVPGT